MIVDFSPWNTMYHQTFYLTVFSNFSLKNVLLFFSTADVSKESFMLAASPPCKSCRLAPATSTWLSVYLKVTHDALIKAPVTSSIIVPLHRCHSWISVHFLLEMLSSHGLPLRALPSTPPGLVKYVSFLSAFHLVIQRPFPPSLPVTDPTCALAPTSWAIFPLNWKGSFSLHLILTWSTLGMHFFIDRRFHAHFLSILADGNHRRGEVTIAASSVLCTVSNLNI